MALFKLLGAFALLPYVYLLHAGLVYYVWNWAASPVFLLRHITLLEASAAALVATALKPSLNSKADDNRSLGETMWLTHWYYLVLLIVAAVIGGIAQ